MTMQLPIVDFSAEQRELWGRVVDLWAMTKVRDVGQIRATLHPDYVGWDMSAPLPHDRDTAVRSVTGDSPPLFEHELTPLSVQVYDGTVGVVHYAYAATVLPDGAAPIHVTGKWTEVYLKQNDTWVMISVSGRPDASVGR